MSKLSIIIPSRNEQFLNQTVLDLLAKTSIDEIIVVLEGYWPGDPETKTAPLPKEIVESKRVKILHHGRARGMRTAINSAVEIATGDLLAKVDAHCKVEEGFDEVMMADYLEDNWILTPRRKALDAENWCDDTSNPKYPIDYEYLSYGLERPGDPTCNFHGTPWTARRDARKHILLDEDLSSQGSFWMTSRKNWGRIGPMDIDMFGSFFGESQEIGLKTQLLGGAMMRTKKTAYSHLRKSSRYGRFYALGRDGHRRGAAALIRMCMLDQWPGQVRSLQSLLEPFMPIPGWPSDLDRCFREAREKLTAVEPPALSV